MKFTDILNDIQDYRAHSATVTLATLPDVIRERRLIQARIERCWREGTLSRIQRETLEEILEEGKR